MQLHIPTLATAVPHCRHAWGEGGGEDAAGFARIPLSGHRPFALITLTHLPSTPLPFMQPLPILHHSSRQGLGPCPLSACNANLTTASSPTSTPHQHLYNPQTLLRTRHCQCEHRRLEKLGSRAVPQDPHDELHALNAETLTNGLPCAWTA